MDYEELKRRLLKTFRSEAVEHITTISSGLLEIEKQSTTVDHSARIEEIYRAAHSLKGAARAVNLHEIEMLCQALESCFSKIKEGSLTPSAKQFDLFHESMEHTNKLMAPEAKPEEGYRALVRKLNEIADNGQEPIISDDHGSESSNLVDNPGGSNNPEKSEKKADGRPKMKKVAGNDQKRSVDIAQKDEQDKAEETIRIPVKKINDLFLRSEETLQIRLSHQQEYEQVEDMRDDLRKLRSNWSALSHEVLRFRQSIDEIPELADKVEPLFFTTYEAADQLVGSILDKHKTLQKTSRYVERSTHTILDALTGEFKKILIVPLSELFSGFPLLVRDLSKDLGKLVDFEMTGTEVEVDRRIMEKLKDPLIHLLRNSIDHGIESPEVRKEAGKAETGSLKAVVERVDALSIRIIIEDDGLGIDPDKIRNLAEKRGFIDEEARNKLSDEEALQLLFRSGFSTSEIITDISGRGLGMAIVKENVQQLGGKMIIGSKPGKGSHVTIEVPTKLSNAKGLLIRAADQIFVLPVQGIRETLRIAPESLKLINKRKSLIYESKNIPIVHLADLMNLDAVKADEGRKLTVILAEFMGDRIGLVVDEISGEQEILFKPFGFPLKKVRNVAGVCLSGTGKILPVLDVGDIVVGGLKYKKLRIETGELEKGKPKQQSILIAEDSITSRMFLKNVLQGAGFSVKATVDGKEAWTELKQNSYDILVTDIEMPRMTGFELTERVKNDPKLKSMPVILVTSLSRREDRERGIDAGADAYIMKSTFDQSNLVEVIKRFI